MDILLCRPHAHLRKLGTQCCVRKEDALCVIEVKGNCTGTDLKKASKKAIVIRDLQGQRAPLYGIVCYRVALELKTIMKRFGFSFDGENKTYFDNATIPNELEENWLSIKYPDLDFFVSLEDEKKLFLRKYEMQPGKFRFVRSVREPIIQELFSMIQSLWVTSNQGPAI